jgi:AraC-like DNA-binding protein
VTLSKIQMSPSAFLRTRRHLGDCCEDFWFSPITAGWQGVVHNGHTTRLDQGDTCLMNIGQAGDGFFPEGGSVIAIRVDGTSIRALVKHPEEMAGIPIRHSHPGMALLMGYVRSIYETADTLTPELQHRFGLHVVDIIASIVGATRDGSAQAEAGGLRSARLRQVLDAIATRACDSKFGVEAVAAELAVTSRTIQLMFEETGSTFSEHVSEHRLRRAWQLLADPKSGLTIAEVAYEAGFNDLSHFYRAFRRRFGETPASARMGVRKLH